MKNLMFCLMLFSSSVIFLACPNQDDNDLCVPVLEEDCICYQVYDPVCGCDNKTYSNDCVARCNGIENFTPGPCN